MLVLALLLQAAPACPPVRATAMTLAFDAFDQDMAGGWRALANRGCDAQAADLIRDWRAAHPATDPGRQGLLAWHEAQMRANAGQTAAAIALFETARKPPATDRLGWNPYVDATIAFLERDTVAFAAARTRLAAWPRPAGFAPVGPDGKPRVVRWPMNLDVLDGLRRCWDRPYREAYACAAPLFVVGAPAAK